jgi:acetoacetyl-CoA synthetase
VAAIAAGLADAGVVAGDVVAGILPNRAEAVIAMLAATSLGAVWTSVPPDFGADAIVDRLGRVGAKALFTVTGYFHAGRHWDVSDRIDEVIRRLDGLQVLVGVDVEHKGARMQSWKDWLQRDAGASPPYLRLPFNAPVFVMYTSGTTGPPKAILHGIGGTLLQHRKEHLLHVDLKPRECLFFYTTTGWMMWNWLVSGLASGATVLLFDGSPVHPSRDALWDLAAEERVAHFGTSPRYLASQQRAGVSPRTKQDLGALRSLLSTGSPLAPGQFDYVYESVSPDLHLASMSGGTDILSCFCLGVPWLPVRAGEIQGAGLGMATEVLDDAGRPVRDRLGELCCLQGFPSVPLGFVGDTDGSRFRRAYFERFPGVWHHGDSALRTAAGSFVIQGRSDAVLNPGGVRIGTAEIYRQVAKIPEVIESLAISQKWRDADERVILFVLLDAGCELDRALQTRIREVIRDNASPRHVPALIIAAPGLPRTRNGKLAELAVRNAIHGWPVENRDALEDAVVLDWFYDVPALRA